MHFAILDIYFCPFFKTGGPLESNKLTNYIYYSESNLKKLGCDLANKLFA
jgi:hypothetical protein